MEVPSKQGLTLGWRVFVGLGFWTVGIAGVLGGMHAVGETVPTKIDMLTAEWHGDQARLVTASNRLHDQQTEFWVDLATGVASIATGAVLTRGGQQLWAGPFPQPEPVPTPGPLPEELPAGVASLEAHRRRQAA